MDEDHTKLILKVIFSKRNKHEEFLRYYLDLAAETNGTHGMPIDEFQQAVINQINGYRRQLCANDLQEDDSLHVIAQQIANAKANGNDIPPSNDYNLNMFELNTGDPSRVTGEKYLLIFLVVEYFI